MNREASRATVTHIYPRYGTRRPGESYQPALPENWRRCPQCRRAGHRDSPLFIGKRGLPIRGCVFCVVRRELEKLAP